MKRIDFEVNDSDAQKRVDLFLVERTKDTEKVFSRSQIKTLIDAGKININGKPLKKAGYLLQKGDLVQIEVEPPKPLNLSPQEVGITILFEDEHLAVLEKPSGISVHPSTTEQNPTVVHGLLHSLKTLSSVGGVERPGIVHRIDKGTSGILVVSKTDAAHLHLSKQFKDHSINRKYRALIYGDIATKQRTQNGTIATFFGRNPNNRKKMTGKLTEGRRAITHWNTLELLTGGQLTLIECKLETGRTHQIRVHLSELGFGIVGDPLYGEHARKAKEIKNGILRSLCTNLNHQLLHAYLLEFTHPQSGARLKFESKLPEDFSKILDQARLKES